MSNRLISTAYGVGCGAALVALGLPESFVVALGMTVGVGVEIFVGAYKEGSIR